MESNLLSHLSRAEQDRLLEEIEKREPLTAIKIRQKMFIFEDILRLEDKGLQILLRTVPQETLTLALRKTSEEIQETIYKNLSARAAQLLKEEVENLAPQRLSKVTTAQQEVADIAKELIRQGKIFLKK